MQELYALPRVTEGTAAWFRRHGRPEAEAWALEQMAIELDALILEECLRVAQPSDDWPDYYPPPWGRGTRQPDES